MTLDSKKYLHPEAIKRISRLEIRARHIVEGFLSGNHRSPYFGQSVEFLQHREYAPGDDLRHVDWKVWAKQDRLYVKQFEEETNMRCTLLVDASGSMNYGNGPLNKFDYAATVAVSLAYLILRQQDAVACMTFDEKLTHQVPMCTSQKQVLSVAQALEKVGKSDPTSLYPILLNVANASAKRGLMILCSDLFGDIEETLKGLRILRQQGHDVMVFHILDDDELEFPFTGPTKFDSLESEDQLTCNPKALREGYLAALETFLTKIRRGCVSYGIDYALIRTSDPLDAALASFLCNRIGSHHRN